MADFISDYRENSYLHPDVSKIIIFSCVFGLKARVFIMNADYAVVRDLAILNGIVF